MERKEEGGGMSLSLHQGRVWPNRTLIFLWLLRRQGEWDWEKMETTEEAVGTIGRHSLSLQWQQKVTEERIFTHEVFPATLQSRAIFQAFTAFMPHASRWAQGFIYPFYSRRRKTQYTGVKQLALGHTSKQRSPILLLSKEIRWYRFPPQSILQFLQTWSL